MTEHVDQVSPEAMAEMRAWAEAAFPEEGVAAYWTDEEVVAAVDGHCAGGADGWSADA